MKPCLSLALVALLFLMTPAPGSLAKKKAEATPRKLHTFSSVKPYVEHALKGCQCRWIDDAFEQRDCKKQCKGFKRKMLAWATKNPVLHESLEIDVGKYNFRSRSFTLEVQDLMVEAENVPGSVIIGNGRCDSMTGMPMTSQRIIAKMKEKDAKRSVLRGSDEASATAVLVGKASSLNWCCDSYTRREAAMDGVSCNGRVFKYTIKELAIPEAPDPSLGSGEEDPDDDERPWYLGFKTPVEALDFEPRIIGYEDFPGDLDD
jgi:hypothetical protein